MPPIPPIHLPPSLPPPPHPISNPFFTIPFHLSSIPIGWLARRAASASPEAGGVPLTFVHPPFHSIPISPSLSSSPLPSITPCPRGQRPAPQDSGCDVRSSAPTAPSRKPQERYLNIKAPLLYLPPTAFVVSVNHLLFGTALRVEPMREASVLWAARDLLCPRTLDRVGAY